MSNIDLQTILINKATVDLWDRGILEIVGDTIILKPSGVQASIEGWTPEQLRALPIVHAGFRCVICFRHVPDLLDAKGWLAETYLIVDSNEIYIGAVCPEDIPLVSSIWWEY